MNGWRSCCTKAQSRDLFQFIPAAAYGSPECTAKKAALTLVAASADVRDLGAVFDHEEPLLHPACDQAQPNIRDGGWEASPGSSWQGCARLVRREPATHVGVHRIARNNHRVRTTALRAVERAVFET